MTSSPTGKRSFTIIELITVVAIMAILIAIAVPGIRSLQAAGMQTAVRQVSNALQLTRQYAITTRAPARFVIPVSVVGGGRSDLVCRAYSICVATNDAEGNLTGWIPLEEWQFLPAGIIFGDVNTTDYSPATANPVTSLGTATFQVSNSTGGWRYFNSTNSMTVFIGSTSTNWVVSAAEFRPTGTGGNITSSSGAAGIRLVQGQILNAGSLTAVIRDTNNWAYVEYDQFTGRVRVRYADSYQ